MKRCVVAMAAFAAVLGAAFGEAKLVREIREGVHDNWEKITESCVKAQELADEMPGLPDRTWFFGTDKRDQLEKIRKLQRRIREELLSVDSRKLLEKAEKLADKCKERKLKLARLRESRAFTSPDRREKLDREIREEEGKLAELEAEQKAELAKVREELAAIGLQGTDQSLNVLLSMSDRADVIDNVLLAKGISEVVGGLREALVEGDALSAKRYYGVYLALVDVHAFCFEQYLEKSRHGEWRQGLDRIEANADVLIDNARRSLSSGDYGESEREVFRRSIEDNGRLKTGVELYRKLLGMHETAVDRKLAEVRKQRSVVEALYGTVSGAMSFGQLMKLANDDYAAVMELELPDLAIVSDGLTEDQIDSISRMLDMGR